MGIWIFANSYHGVSETRESAARVLPMGRLSVSRSKNVGLATIVFVGVATLTIRQLATVHSEKGWGNPHVCRQEHRILL